MLLSRTGAGTHVATGQSLTSSLQALFLTDQQGRIRDVSGKYRNINQGMSYVAKSGVCSDNWSADAASTSDLNFAGGIWTVCVWFNLSGTIPSTTTEYLFTRYFWSSSSVNNGWLVVVDGSGVGGGRQGVGLIQFNGTGNTLSQNAALSPGDHCAVIQCNGTVAQIYLDGALVASSSSMATATSNTTNGVSNIFQTPVARTGVYAAAAWTRNLTLSEITQLCLPQGKNLLMSPASGIEPPYGLSDAMYYAPPPSICYTQVDAIDTFQPINLPSPVNTAHTLNQGRIAWWLTLPGMDGGNRFYDIMGQYNGTLMNMGTGNGWQGTTRPGGYGQISGTRAQSTYISCGSPAALGITGNLTVACWVNMSASPPSIDAFSLISKDGDTGGRAYTLDAFNGGAGVTNFRFYVNGGGTGSTNEIVATASASINTWYRVVATYSTSGTINIYINGVNCGISTGNVTSIPTATAELRLGGRVYAGYQDYFSGALDDCSIWNRVLTPTEIAQDYLLSQVGYSGVLNRLSRSTAGTNTGLPTTLNVSFDTLQPVDLTSPVNVQHPLNQGRVGWWLTLPGTDGGNTWYDICGLNNGVLGSMNNANNGWRGTTRPGGQGHMLLDGSAGYVSIADNPSLRNTTASIAIWFKTTNGATSTIVRKDTQSGTRYLYGIDIANGNPTGTVQCNYYNSVVVTSASSTATYNDGKWHRAVGVITGAVTATLYIDGAFVATTTTSSTIGSPSGELDIGAAAPNWEGVLVARAFFFQGSVDDVSVWNRALSAAEVQQDYLLSQAGYPGVLNRWSRSAGGTGASTIAVSNNIAGRATLSASANELMVVAGITAVTQADVIDTIQTVNLSCPVNTQHSLNQGRVAWWLTLPGTDGGNTWYDICGLNNGVLGSMNNANNGWRGTTRPGGQGHMLLDGLAGYVSIPVSQSLQTTTTSMAAWFNTTVGTYSTIVRADSLSGTRYLHGIAMGENHPTGTVQCHFFNGTTLTEASSTALYNDGKWHRAVGIISGAVTATLYIDGVFVATTTTSSTMGAPNGELDIGANPPYYDGTSHPRAYYFTGSVDDVSFWNRALSATEVQQDYLLSQAGYPGVLNRHTRMNSCSTMSAVSVAACAIQSDYIDTFQPVNLSCPVNMQHSLSQGRFSWWLTLPGLDAGNIWYDIAGMSNASLINMTSAYGWKGTTRIGGAGQMSFDGATDYVIAPMNTVFGDFTISVWINTTRTVEPIWFSQSSSNGSNPFIMISLGTIVLSGIAAGCVGAFVRNNSGSGGIFATSAYIADGHWHCITLTLLSSTTVSIYIDGVRYGTGTISAPNWISLTGTSVTVGGSYNSSYYLGAIDDVAMWSRCLSSGEVLQNYLLSRQGYPGVLNRFSRAIGSTGLSGSTLAIVLNLIGSAGVGAVGASLQQAIATIQGLGILTPAAASVVQAIETLQGIGVVATTAASVIQAVKTLQATGILTPTAASVVQAVETLQATGALNASAGSVEQAVATLTGDASIIAAGLMPTNAATQTDSVDTLQLVDVSSPVNTQHSLNQGRVAWWLTLPGLDGGGTWYDIMGAHNGALVNMGNVSSGWRGSTRPGGFGHVLFNSAISSYVNTAYTSNLGDFTVAVWFYVSNSTNGASARLVDKNYQTGFWFGKDATGAANSWGGGILQATTPYGTYATCQDGQWNRLVMSRAGTTQTIYVNGVVGATATVVSTALDGSALTVGWAAGGNSYITGSVDDVSIWSRALSPVEIQQDYLLSKQGYPGVLNRWLRSTASTGSSMLLAIIMNLIGSASIGAIGASLQQASASIVGKGIVFENVAAITFAGAALQAQGVLAPTAASVVQAAEALNGIGVLNATATDVEWAIATLQAAGVLNTTAASIVQAVAALQGAAVVSASNGSTIQAVATLQGAGVLNETVSSVEQAVANLQAAGVLHASPGSVAQAIATLQGVGVITASPGSIAQASATLLAAGILNASVTDIEQAVATLQGAAALNASAVSVAQSVEMLTGAAKVVASAVNIQLATAALTGAASLNDIASSAASVTASVIGVGSIHAAAAAIASGTAQLNGAGILTSQGLIVDPATAALIGAGSLNANGISGNHANIIGVGVLNASAQVATFASANLTGNGLLSAQPHIVCPAVANPQGSASVAASVTLVLMGEVNLVGAALLSSQGTSLNRVPLFSVIGGIYTDPFSDGATDDVFTEGTMDDPFSEGTTDDPFTEGTTDDPFTEGTAEDTFGFGAYPDTFGLGKVRCSNGSN